MRAVGIVAQQDLTNWRVRVTFPDRGNVLSWWLGIAAPKTQNDKFAWMPDVGEQVLCLMDENFEDGDVLGGRYSTVDTPPISSGNKSFHLTTKDASVFDYDRVAHALSIALCAGASISITLNGATIAVDSSGDVSVNTPGNASVTAGGEAIVNAPSIVLAGGGPAVARVGDSTTCPAGPGHITSGSSKVQSG
jgi:phage baseplate assembly protein V